MPLSSYIHILINSPSRTRSTHLLLWKCINIKMKYLLFLDYDIFVSKVALASARAMENWIMSTSGSDNNGRGHRHTWGQKRPIFCAQNDIVCAENKQLELCEEKQRERERAKEWTMDFMCVCVLSVRIIIQIPALNIAERSTFETGERRRYFPVKIRTTTTDKIIIGRPNKREKNT